MTIWILAFIAKPRRFWWDWLYRGPWRHVVAFRYDPEAQVWIAIDWNHIEMTVKAWRRYDVAGLWTQIVNDGGLLIRWEGPVGTRPRVCWPAYCTTVLAHAIGLHRWAPTPRWFVSALRATGGTDFLIGDTAPEQDPADEQHPPREGA